jgi:sigma-E factor negative regulatory protein RseC
MVTEKGIVIRLGKPEPPTIWVKMVQGSACASCSERNSCNTMSNSREREVEILNKTGAVIGDRVEVSMDSWALLKAAFLLYVFPILCMLIGAVTGDVIATHFHYTGSLPAVIMALLGLASALMVVKVRGNRLASQAAYRPQAIRVIEREAGQPGDGKRPTNCRSITPQE